MPVETCVTCGKSLGSMQQADLFRPGLKCIACLTKERITMMLNLLPDEGTKEFARLSDFAREFIPSVREQFARKHALSEKQYQVLESIYEKEQQ